MPAQRISDPDAPIPATASGEPDPDEWNDTWTDADFENAVTPAEQTLAQSLEEEMRTFWETHDPMALKQSGDLRRILFAKVKHRVPNDLKIPGASQPGEEQHVVAVVSREYVLRQLQSIIKLRHEWLEKHGLPLDFHMRDEIERPKFLKWVRGLYEQEEYQRQRQAEDWEEGGADSVRKRKRQRWSREQQRRCGSPAMWCIISFTGKLDAEFLSQGTASNAGQSSASAGASQPDASCGYASWSANLYG